jgi:hypothetical protein
LTRLTLQQLPEVELVACMLPRENPAERLGWGFRHPQAVESYGCRIAGHDMPSLFEGG